MKVGKNSECLISGQYQAPGKVRASHILFAWQRKKWDLPGLSVFHRSAGRLSLLSGVPMGPKLENGAELWLCVGGELGRLLGLEE